MRRGNLNISNDEKILLHPMKFEMPRSSLTAIVGPLEGGKTVLLKFLAQMLEKSVRVEGYANLQGTKSYLEENGDLHRFYTPREYMQHYDRLTMGNFKCEKSTEEIDSLLESLGFKHDRKDTIVGDMFRKGLSKGEIRRLELGLMVLSAPNTLFCNKPISGLDSTTALNIMKLLKGYASHKDRRVIITLDQPSSMIWNFVDNVILLSYGKLIYAGPRFDMESFFAINKYPTPRRFNPIDHYISVVSEYEAIEMWNRRFEQ